MSPRQVLDEIAGGQRLGYFGGIDPRLVGEVELTESESRRAEELGARLGAGEAACLAVSEARGALLLTDDRAARKIGRALGIEVSGTLGVLVRIVDVGSLTLSEADDFLARMVQAGYRCPVSSVGELL